jgi:hypothetical protein
MALMRTNTYVRGLAPRNFSETTNGVKKVTVLKIITALIELYSARFLTGKRVE